MPGTAFRVFTIPAARERTIIMAFWARSPLLAVSMSFSVRPKISSLSRASFIFSRLWASSFSASIKSLREIEFAVASGDLKSSTFLSRFHWLVAAS